MKIGHRRVLWQILAALAGIAEDKGNSAKAAAYRDEARHVVGHIAERCASELRPSFLSLPAVQSILRDQQNINEKT